MNAEANSLGSGLNLVLSKETSGRTSSQESSAGIHRMGTTHPSAPLPRESKLLSSPEPLLHPESEPTADGASRQHSWGCATALLLPRPDVTSELPRRFLRAKPTSRTALTAHCPAALRQRRQAGPRPGSGAGAGAGAGQPPRWPRRLGLAQAAQPPPLRPRFPRPRPPALDSPGRYPPRGHGHHAGALSARQKLGPRDAPAWVSPEKCNAAHPSGSARGRLRKSHLNFLSQGPPSRPA